MEDTFRDIIFQHREALKAVEENRNNIVLLSRLLRNTLKENNKIIICGNGGSAADAQHFAAELVGRFNKNRRPLPAIALTTDTSIITAVANDFGFKEIFKKQIEAWGKKGDILIAISTSGNSENVIEAVKTAKQKGIKTVGLVGKNGGKIKKIVDLPIVIQSKSTARIQEMHILILHTVAEIIENSL